MEEKKECLTPKKITPFRKTYTTGEKNSYPFLSKKEVTQSILNIKKYINKIYQITQKYDYSQWNHSCDQILQYLNTFNYWDCKKIRLVIPEVEGYFQGILCQMEIKNNMLRDIATPIIQPSIFKEHANLQRLLMSAFDETVKPNFIESDRFELLQFFWLYHFGFNKQEVSMDEFVPVLANYLKREHQSSFDEYIFPTMVNSLVTTNNNHISFATFCKFGYQFGPFNDKCANRMASVCDIFGRRCFWFRPDLNHDGFLDLKTSNPDIEIIVSCNSRHSNHEFSLFFDSPHYSQDIISLEITEDGNYYIPKYSSNYPPIYYETLYDVITLKWSFTFKNQVQNMSKQRQKFEFLKICTMLQNRLENSTDSVNSTDVDKPTIQSAFIENSLYDNNVLGEIVEFM